jgi:hypothetical protein
MFGYTGDGVPAQESTALGAKPYTYHQRELIVPDRVLRTPQGQMHGNALLSMMKATMPEHRVKGFANGGFAAISASVGATVGQSKEAQNMAKEIGKEILEGIKTLPVPVVKTTPLLRDLNREQVKQKGGLR